MPVAEVISTNNSLSTGNSHYLAALGVSAQVVPVRAARAASVRSSWGFAMPDTVISNQLQQTYHRAQGSPPDKVVAVLRKRVFFKKALKMLHRRV